jgi:hypothetical protein
MANHYSQVINAKHNRSSSVPPMFGDVRKENFQRGSNYSLQGFQFLRICTKLISPPFFFFFFFSKILKKIRYFFEPKILQNHRAWDVQPCLGETQEKFNLRRRSNTKLCCLSAVDYVA